ncbi:QueT transporter family protein [Candidatus Bathyarchaeota archaeon]|nr:MAG: QueT transporter family protein [Candidatus Bathyarchaeota archaeon]
MVETTLKETARSRTLLRDLTLASVFAALYAVLVVAFAGNSFLPVQLRVADMLMPLVILFGWPVALGLGIGALVGNFAGETLLGFQFSSIAVDMIFGGITNLLAGIVAWQIGRRGWTRLGRNKVWFLATSAETVIISLVVGSYLYIILGIPAEIIFYGFTFSGLLASIAGITVGSIVAINILGYALLLGLARPQTIRALKARGLRVQTEEK